MRFTVHSYCFFIVLYIDRANSQKNLSVRARIKQEIVIADKHNKFDSLDVESEIFILFFCIINCNMNFAAAIKRYFESRRRLHREVTPEQRARVSLQEKQRKSRSRRQRVSNVYCVCVPFNYTC